MKKVLWRLTDQALFPQGALCSLPEFLTAVGSDPIPPVAIQGSPGSTVNCSELLASVFSTVD